MKKLVLLLLPLMGCQTVKDLAASSSEKAASSEASTEPQPVMEMKAESAPVVSPLTVVAAPSPASTTSSAPVAAVSASSLFDLQNNAKNQIEKADRLLKENLEKNQKELSQKLTELKLKAKEKLDKISLELTELNKMLEDSSALISEEQAKAVSKIYSENAAELNRIRALWGLSTSGPVAESAVKDNKVKAEETLSLKSSDEDFTKKDSYNYDKQKSEKKSDLPKILPKETKQKVVKKKKSSAEVKEVAMPQILKDPGKELFFSTNGK